MSWFNKKKTADNKVDINPIYVTDLPQLRIFGLRPSLDLVATTTDKKVNDDTMILLPTVTRGGRLSYVNGGTPKEYDWMQADIKRRFNSQMSELNIAGARVHLGQFLVIGYILTSTEEWESGVSHLVYETFVSPKLEAAIELSQIYSLLDNTDRSKIEAFFSDKGSKQVWWLDGFITNLENGIDWRGFVNKAEQMWQEKAKKGIQ